MGKWGREWGCEHMNLRTHIVALLVVASAAAHAQTEHSPASKSSEPPPGARYEVVQSPIAVRWTFRLDRFNGRVQQLVATKEGGMTWQPMAIHSPPALGVGTKPRFQIFMSGVVARTTLLLDTDLGNTWVLVKTKDGGDEWEPLE